MYGKEHDKLDKLATVAVVTKNRTKSPCTPRENSVTTTYHRMWTRGTEAPGRNGVDAGLNSSGLSYR